MKLHKILLLALFVATLSCSKKDSDDSSSSSSRLLPEITPIVKETLAENLQPQSFRELSSEAENLYPMANTPEAIEALSDFFTDNYGNISGQTKQGLIFAYLADVDGRAAEITFTGESQPTCLETAAIDVTFTATTGHSMVLKLSCARKFASATDQSGEGSGLAYGIDDNYYYLYLMLSQKSTPNDKFGFAAKVNKTSKEVEMLFLESNVTYSRVKFANLKANPESKNFEYATAATSDGVGPISSNTAHVLSHGVRLVSNGNAIKAEGSVVAQTNTSGAPMNGAQTYAFDASECLSAASLTTTTDCGSLAFNMSLITATALNSSNSINASLYTMEALITLGLTQDDGSVTESTGSN